MSQQKAFKKSNLHLTIWSYRDNREKEIVCNKKDTLSIENGIIEVTKLQNNYLHIQVSRQARTAQCDLEAKRQSVADNDSAI